LALFKDPQSGAIDISRLVDYIGSPAGIVLKPISSHASKGIIFGPVETPTLKALEKVATDLAKLMILDGEGATKLVHIEITGAKNDKDACLMA